MRTRYRVGSVVAALVMVGTVTAWATPTIAGGSQVQRADHFYPPPSGPPTVALARSPEGLVLVTGAGATMPPGATTNAGFALYQFSGDAFPPAQNPTSAGAPVQLHGLKHDDALYDRGTGRYAVHQALAALDGQWTASRRARCKPGWPQHLPLAARVSPRVKSCTSGTRCTPS